MVGETRTLADDLEERREALEKEMEEAFLEVKEILKNDQVYQRWRADTVKRVKGLPVSIPILTDRVRKIANDMRNDEVYLKKIYNLFK